MLRQDDFLKGQIVLEAWRQMYEQGGHLACVLVMGVLACRVRKGWGNWLEVLASLPKHSALKDQPNRDKFPPIWEPQFVRLLHEVEPVFDGTSDPAKGALYWCDTRYIETDFFKDKILSNKDDHPRVVEMNSLALFR